jgi:hypothetical protein
LTDREHADFLREDGDFVDFGGKGRKEILRGARMRGSSAGLRALAAVCASFAAVAAVALGVFFFALTRGPISLDWLAPTLVDSLDELYKGRYRFGLGGASIANGEHGPTLFVERLVVKSGGRTLIAAPRAQMSVDFPSLLIGRIRPRRVEALDLELRLAVLEDGSIAISAGTDPADAIPLIAPAAESDSPTNGVNARPRAALLRQAAGALRGLLDLATSPDPDSAIGAINRVGVSHGRLVIDDKTVGRLFRYDDLSLHLEKGRGAMSFGLGATASSRRWTAEATAHGSPGEKRVFDAKIRDFSLDEVALVVGSRNLKFESDSPLSLTAHFALDPSNHVLEAKGALEVGAGYFRLEDPDHEPFMIDHAVAKAHWDRRLRTLIVNPLTIKARDTEFSFKGSATPPPVGTEDNGWTIAGALTKPGRFAAEREGDKNLVINSVTLAAHLKARDKRMTVERIEVGGPEVNIGASGAIDWSNGPHLIYELSISDTPILALLRLWPTHVAPGVRAWLLEHISSGVVRAARMNADYDNAALTAMRYERPPPDDSMRADFQVANATIVDLLPGAAPLSNIAGQAHITGRTAGFTVSSGVMETAPQRRLTLTEGTFRVANNALRPTPAVIDLRLSGNVEVVGDLLALKSVAEHASLPIESGSLKGQIDGRLKLDFEIGSEARPEATTFTIDATTSNLTIEKLVGKEKLENGALNVIADPVGLHVWGSGKMFGAPATLDVSRAHGDKGPAQGRLNFVFDDAARAKAGFAFAGLTGPVNISIKTSLPMDDADAQIELDLSKANVDNLLPGLVKPAGRPGKASMVLAKRAEGFLLDKFLFDAGGAQLAGVIELGREGVFRAAKMSQVRLSPGDEARLEATRAGDALKLVVRAANLDSRPILRALLQGSSASDQRGGGTQSALAGDDFDLDFKSPVVTGHGMQVIANVDLKLERRGGRLRVFSLNGSLGREPLTAKLARGQSGASQIEIAAGDGGSLLSFLDLYHKMDSGALTASVQLGQGRSDGGVRIVDFYLKNEPAMRQLMTQGVARADDKGVMRFDPDSVRFSRLQAAFTWSGGRLSVRDAVISGPEIGLTADGYIDFPRDRIDVTGAYVPAYGINNLLSNIPVLGLVLAGGQHEGVFALNYHVSGAFSAPTLTVNPLSAIAPGLIRKVMGIMDGTTRAPESFGR